MDLVLYVRFPKVPGGTGETSSHNQLRRIGNIERRV